MLIILIEDQIVPPRQVCQSCLLADTSGEPRVSAGRLRCGSPVRKECDQHPDQYECIMGFRLVKID